MTTRDFKESIFTQDNRKTHYDSMDADDFSKGFLVNETLKALKDSFLNSKLSNENIKKVLMTFFNPKEINAINTNEQLISFFDKKIIDIKPEHYELAIQRLPEFENGKMIDYSIEEQTIFHKMKELQKYESEFKKIYFKDKNHNKFGITIGTFLENLQNLLESKLQENLDESFDFFGNSKNSDISVEIERIVDFVKEKAHNDLVKPVSKNGLLRHATTSYVNGYEKTLELSELFKIYPNLLFDTKIEFPYEEEKLEKTYLDPIRAFFNSVPILIENETKDENLKKIVSKMFLKNKKGESKILDGEQININNENIMLELFSKYSNNPEKLFAIKNLLKAFERSTLITRGITNLKDLLSNEMDEKELKEKYIQAVSHKIVLFIKEFNTKYGYIRNSTKSDAIMTYLDFKLDDIVQITTKLDTLANSLNELEKKIQTMNDKDDILNMIEDLKILKDKDFESFSKIELNVFLLVLEYQLKGSLTEKILDELKITTPFSEFQKGTIVTDFKFKNIFGIEKEANFKYFNVFNDYEKMAQTLEVEESNVRNYIANKQINTKHTIYYNPETEESLPIAANEGSIRLRKMLDLLMNNFKKAPFFSGLAGDGKTTLINEVSQVFGFPNVVKVQPTDFLDVVKTLIKGSQNIDKTTFEPLTPSLLEEHLRNGQSFVLILDEFIEVLNKFSKMESPTRIMERFNMLLDPKQTITINAPYTKKGSLKVSIAEMVRIVAIDNNPLNEYILTNYSNFLQRIEIVIENTSEQWQNKNFIQNTVFGSLNVKLNEKLELLKTPTAVVGDFYKKAAQNIQKIMPELESLFKSAEGQEYFKTILKFDKTLNMDEFKNILSNDKFILKLMKDNNIPEKEYIQYVEKIITFAKIQNNAKYFNNILKIENELNHLDFDDRKIEVEKRLNVVRFENVLDFLEIPNDRKNQILEKKLVSVKEVSNFIVELIKSGEISNKTLIEKFGFENKFPNEILVSRIENTIASVYRKFEFDHLWINKKGHLEKSLNNAVSNTKEKADSTLVNLAEKSSHLSKEVSKINSSYFFTFVPGISQFEYKLQDIKERTPTKDIIDIEYKGEQISFSKKKLPNFEFIKDSIGKSASIAFHDNVYSDIENIVENVVELVYVINNTVKDAEVKEYENINMLTYRNIKDVILEKVMDQYKLSGRIDLNDIVKSVLTPQQMEDFSTEIQEKLQIVNKSSVNLFTTPNLG